MNSISHYSAQVYVCLTLILLLAIGAVVVKVKQCNNILTQGVFVGVRVQPQARHHFLRNFQHYAAGPAEGEQSKVHWSWIHTKSRWIHLVVTIHVVLKYISYRLYPTLPNAYSVLEPDYR